MLKSSALWIVLALAGACGVVRDAVTPVRQPDGSVDYQVDSSRAGDSVEKSLPPQFQGWGLGALVTALLGGGGTLLTEKKRAERERAERRQERNQLKQEIEDLKTQLAELLPSVIGLEKAPRK